MRSLSYKSLGGGSSLKGYRHKLVLFLSSSLDFAAGDRLLGQLDFWCGQMHSSSLTGFQVAQTNHSSLLNLHVVWRNAGLELSRNVKSKGKKILFGCRLHRGRLKDEGLLTTWSNCIMVPCAAFSAGELHLMSIMDGTRVLPH